MKLRLHSMAEADLWSGFMFYERQRHGLGDYFLSCLDSDVESLKLYAGIHRRVFGYHRLLSKRFPVAIYYDQHADEVRIWRILDCRRQPGWIKAQLSRAPDWGP